MKIEIFNLYVEHILHNSYKKQGLLLRIGIQVMPAIVFNVSLKH